MSTPEQFADAILGHVETQPQRVGRIMRELEAAGAKLEDKSAGRSFIRPGSVDRTKLSAEAVNYLEMFEAEAPGAGSVSTTDREIALHVATFGKGMSETEALRALALDGDKFLAENRADIDAHRHRLEREATEAHRVAFEASPEGRKIAAAEAAQAEARESELENNARALLVRDAEAYGIRAADVENLTRAEVLRASGIVPNARDERDAADRDPAVNLARALGEKEGE
jgi:hypothetical protein